MKRKAKDKNELGTGKMFAKLFLAITCVLFLFSSCTKSMSGENFEKTYKFSSVRYQMSTAVSQTIYIKGDTGEEKTKAKADKIMQEAFDIIADYEERMSLYLDGSEIDEINANAGVDPVTVSEDVYEMIEKAVEYSAHSKGKFDITIAPITLLWGVQSDTPHVPTQQEIDKLLPLVSSEIIELDEEKQTVFLREKGAMLDLGAIAKGAVCDPINVLYEAREIEGALLSVGGNILAYGLPGDGREGYSIGIRAPITGAEELLGTVDMTGIIIASSGGYERFFEQDGVIYNHIFDTKTGYPFESDFLGVSILTKNGMYADYMSTYLYTLSLEEMLNIRENRLNEDYEFIAIDKNGIIYLSSGLETNFVKNEALEEFQLAGVEEEDEGR